ncbi:MULTISPECIES: hypothetical protein [unclassified Sphingomonas]|uniref:hypothetical protein n=1 Tax=unclassified Sphingomonas TaxID=196159 RepID=UPI002269F874|nr:MULTISPECIES: hypothetical protein [unclassified Sphingomonas]
MSSPFPARSVALLAAIVAAGLELWLTIRADLDPMFALPLAIATGAVAIWSCLALDALIRRRARPDRTDIIDIRDLQHSNRVALDDHGRRIGQMETMLAFLATQPALDEAEDRLAAAATAVERWESLQFTLPIWYDARRAWTALAERLAPGCTAGADMPDSDELRIAREQLPMTQNFSSEDLKAAIHYITQVQHMAVSRNLLQVRRNAVFEAANFSSAFIDASVAI